MYMKKKNRTLRRNPVQTTVPERLFLYMEYPYLCEIKLYSTAEGSGRRLDETWDLESKPQGTKTGELSRNLRRRGALPLPLRLFLVFLFGHHDHDDHHHHPLVPPPTTLRVHMVTLCQGTCLDEGFLHYRISLTSLRRY